jgi:hypothetical protein
LDHSHTLFAAGQSECCANGTTKYIVVPRDKKNRNKKEFIKKNGEEVNVETDEAIVPGDTHHSDLPMEPAETTRDPSIDTVMMQPDEGAGRVEQESRKRKRSVHPAKLRLDMKAKRLKKERERLAGLSLAVQSTSSVLETSLISSWFKFIKNLMAWK